MIDGWHDGAEAPTALRNYGFLASVRGRHIKPVSRPLPTTCFIDRARAALSEICQRAKVATCDKSKFSISRRYFATLMSENMNTFKVLTLRIRR